MSKRRYLQLLWMNFRQFYPYLGLFGAIRAARSVADMLKVHKPLTVVEHSRTPFEERIVLQRTIDRHEAEVQQANALFDAANAPSRSQELTVHLGPDDIIWKKWEHGRREDPK